MATWLFRVPQSHQSAGASGQSLGEVLVIQHLAVLAFVQLALRLPSPDGCLDRELEPLRRPGPLHAYCIHYINIYIYICVYVT